ncbi:polyprenyl synthetase family protein [Clostridium sp. AF15-41]|nr:polyprenyl synthetase family protein [Clostridium sp. AF15-41]
MNYSFQAGGKRLRPLLMQETYRLFGGTGKVVEPFMAAIEMIHTYSLIHDDLPALDNDEYRRGRKTSHVVFGEAMAILAGDALLNYAFETACKAFELEPGNQTVARAFMILAKKAGVNGMIGGQVVDVEMTGKQMSGDQLHFVYENKTGALIEASMMIGAVLAGATEDELKQVEMIASDIGLAFQIQDDLLDILGDSAVLGKPVCSDEENGKVTYVTVHGLEESKKDVAEISRRAVTRLDQLPYKNEFLDELILELVNRKK